MTAVDELDGDDDSDGDNKTGVYSDADMHCGGGSKIVAESGLAGRALLDVHGLSAMLTSIGDSGFCIK